VSYESWGVNSPTLLMGVDNSLTYLIAYLFTYVLTAIYYYYYYYYYYHHHHHLQRYYCFLYYYYSYLLTYLLSYLLTYLLTCSNMTAHISKTVSNCFSAMRLIRIASADLFPKLFYFRSSQRLFFRVLT